jgi:ATP-dependent DNA helicase PIF1
MLTPDQKAALKLMMAGHNMFITGIPGSGKSYLVSHFVSVCKGRRIALTATTGIAATSIMTHACDAAPRDRDVLDLLRRAAGAPPRSVASAGSSGSAITGTTIHHFSGAGLFNMDYPRLVARVKRNKNSKKRWLNTDVLIIDEVSMLTPFVLDALDYIGRAIRGNDEPFGGIQLILVGDFNQTEPVYKNGRPEKVYAFEANAWSHVTHMFQLTTNMRQSKDAEFRAILSRVRTNSMTADDRARIEARIGVEPPPNSDCIMIYTHNMDVDSINNAELSRLCGATEYQVYPSQTIVTEQGKKLITQEFIEKNVLAPTNLKLCVGCKVMLLANLDVSEGLANGAVGYVDSFSECGKHPRVRFGGAVDSGKERIIDIMPYTWKFEDDGVMLGAFTQYPLKLAYAATVHKTQGMTFARAMMDLSRVFAHGMLYTALSRVKSLEGLYLRGINWKMAAVDKAIIDFNQKNFK